MSGILAGFETEDALRRALARLASEDVGEVETYTPKALDEHPRGSPLPLLMFLTGMGGFVGFFLLMAYADLRAYPLDIGGRPEFAWPSFVPIAFELGVLCAMGAGFFGYFGLCRMPRPYEPIDECDSFRRASRDGWFVAVRSADPQRIVQARAVLDMLRPTSVEEFAAWSRTAVLLLGLGLALLSGCDDMTVQPKQKVYAPQVGPAKVPSDTVEFQEKPVPPPPVTLALIERGQERFHIYCAPCHSELGDGHGMVVQRGFPAPPSFHTAALRAASVQHFFDVDTHGYGAMYSFANRVQPADRWAIAAYIRALQRSQNASLADVAPDQRGSLP